MLRGCQEACGDVGKGTRWALGLLLGTEYFIQWGKVVLGHMNKAFRFHVRDYLTLSLFLML